MVYRATPESTTQTPIEMRAEAQRIMDMGMDAATDRMSERERKFVEDTSDNLEVFDWCPSVKQLWWLRDLKDKYLL